MARRRGKAASRLHVRIVTLFSLVAAIPADGRRHRLGRSTSASTAGSDQDQGHHQLVAVDRRGLRQRERATSRTRRCRWPTTSTPTALLRPRPHRLPHPHEPARRRPRPHSRRADPLSTAPSSCRPGLSRLSCRPPIEAVPHGGDACGPDRAARAQHHRRHRQAARSRTPISTIRSSPEVIKARQIIALQHRRVPRARKQPADHAGGLRARLSRRDADRGAAAIWTGIALADRLVRPIRQLIGAADEVATGNLDVAVPVRSGGDVGSRRHLQQDDLQLKSQRNELVSAKDLIDERRRFSEAVLAGVTAGVIGIDRDGVISIVNRSAERICRSARGRARPPAFRDAAALSAASSRSRAERPRRPSRTGHILPRRLRGAPSTCRSLEEAAKGRPPTSSRSTTSPDLVSAQRSSAWADVARRIAHEIKNPLTRSGSRRASAAASAPPSPRTAGVFDQCQTIIRQVGDIGRMVDEFSAFARMPKPDMQTIDLREPLRGPPFLVRGRPRRHHVYARFRRRALTSTFDARLLSQAFGNLDQERGRGHRGGRARSGEKGTI